MRQGWVRHCSIFIGKSIAPSMYTSTHTQHTCTQAARHNRQVTHTHTHTHECRCCACTRASGGQRALHHRHRREAERASEQGGWLGKPGGPGHHVAGEEHDAVACLLHHVCEWEGYVCRIVAGEEHDAVITLVPTMQLSLYDHSTMHLSLYDHSTIYYHSTITLRCSYHSTIILRCSYHSTITLRCSYHSCIICVTAFVCVCV
jgi:hypothetical protein